MELAAIEQYKIGISSCYVEGYFAITKLPLELSSVITLLLVDRMNLHPDLKVEDY